MKSINLLFLIILSIINKAYQIQYTNPVLPKDAPDPKVIKADNSLYYLYTTGEGIYKSSNLVQWTCIRNVFDGKKKLQLKN